MASTAMKEKPHAVCIPFPAQGHVNPMLKVAKLLHHKGFHITFVNTEYNHNRLIKSKGPNSLNGFPSFRFETIPDGLPPSELNETQDPPSISDSTRKTCLPPFRELLHKLNTSDNGDPPVSCIVSDGVMSFTLDAAEELGIPDVLFWTASACGFLAYLHYKDLIEKGYTPLKDQSYLTNGYLDTEIDWIPGMEGLQLRDIPSFIRTTDPNCIMLDFFVDQTERAKRASAIIINTLDDLEHDVLTALSSMLPPIYPIGSIQLQVNNLPDNKIKNIASNLWKEDIECLRWLDTKEPNSVVYVNFGSVTVMTADQLTEFAWGLANSKQTFLWIIRPDLVKGESGILPTEFLIKTKERGLLSSWCAQEQVLNHPSVAGFLMHSGWNSTLESIYGGVPMICWPFFADQQTNCRFCCKEWGIGMEIDNNVKRDEVEKLVRELMEGQNGKEMKKRVMELKKLVEKATIGRIGSSCINLEKVINEVLLSKRK